MIIKLLGILDFLTIGAVFLGLFGAKKYLLIAGVYHIGKGFLFGRSFVNYIEILCGIYICLLAVGFSINIITIIVILWLIQKAIMSLI